MILYKSATTADELRHILHLQARNLPEVLSEEEKLQEGFVTVRHDYAILDRMNQECPHTIATQNARVIGYALSMHPKFGQEIEVLKPMFKKIESATRSKTGVSFKEYVVMGQICIDKEFRRQGIFRGLYIAMRERMAPTFDAIITEVDIKNHRSLAAHYAIGFESLCRYKSKGQEWDILYLKTQ